MERKEMIDKRNFGDVNFTDMRISEVGFGKDEYRTSKPNILKNDAVVQEILAISDAAETAIGHTIGPYADATLIQTYADREVPIYPTRDGFTILKNMKFTQPIPNAIFMLLREASEYMNTKIGDSTSSGIPIQNTLIHSYYDIFNNQTSGKWTYSPVGIKNITDICIQEIIKGFTDNPEYQVVFPKVNAVGVYDKKEDEDFVIKWLTKVATIAANNDYETGKKIAELYRDKLDGNGHVIPTRSNNEDEYSEASKAFRVAIGLFDQQRMANTADHFCWEADNPVIVMFDGPLLETDLDHLKQIVETVCFDLERPLFITASVFNVQIAQYLRECIDGTHYNDIGQELTSPDVDPAGKPKRLNIAAIQLKNKEIAETTLFEDTLLMTGAKAFSTELGKLQEFSKDRETRKEQILNLAGTCEKISSGYGETNFIGCKPDKAVFEARVKDLREQAEKVKNVRNHFTDHTYASIMDRVDNLQVRTTVYYCGGRSESIRQSRYLVIEDAVQAVAAAIKNGGVSIGGNMCVCHYVEHHFEEIVDKVMEDIGKIRINITAAENIGTLRGIISIILEAIGFSFGSAYRYALYNMYRDPEKAVETWKECVNRPRPCIYNIMTNMIEEFDSELPDECTTIIVPRMTDPCLLKIVTETVSEMINIGNMISLVSPNFDLETLQYEQLKSGAAYMAQSNPMGMR